MPQFWSRDEENGLIATAKGNLSDLDSDTVSSLEDKGYIKNVSGKLMPNYTVLL